MTQDSYEMNANRLTRGSSLFGSDPQVQLRTALRNNDFATFKKLVSYGAVDLEHVYQYPDYKNCLELAISEPDRVEFVKLLLQHEVQVNKINETHGAAPIHFAVENGNVEALVALLEDDRIDVNIKSKGNTALLMAIKKIQDLDDDRERELDLYEEMVEKLLKAGCNANAPDLRGVTPVYSAAKQGLERVVTYILDYSKDTIDLDSYKDIRGRTARYYLHEAFPHLLPKFDSMSESEDVIDVDKLFYYLSRHEEDSFIRDYSKLVKRNEHRPMLAANNGSNTMLQLAVDKGFEKVVLLLLNSGADPNATCASNTNRPVALACRNGYSKILKMFVDNESTLFDTVNSESLVQITVKGMRSALNSPKVDFNACLHLLLTHPKINININHQDVKDNTALHYAARNGDSDTVLELLRKGACVGLHNKFNEPPLADINAKTFETYLDECITTNSQRPSDDDYEIHIKYSFLVYPNNSLENELCKVPLMDNANNNNSTPKEYDAILAPETEALLYMTRNEDLRPLLKHPVITSFLYLKWQRISSLFYANITFYSLLWLCLVLYIILGYRAEKQNYNSFEALNILTHIGAIIGLILLIIRELFQFLVSPTRYLQSIENWMEIALIFVTAWIVCYDSAQESTKQQLSAVAILLSSAELVLLIGQFPTLSTNIVMLRTVSWNFFKFLLWYCILIIAFALSFYTLFRKDQEDDEHIPPNPNKNGQEEEEEEDFFEDPGRSLFKTIVMLTGEFDAGSIKFSTFPVTSHIIFIVFVFMIPIVLFNLLNGLAVSDTQEIRANAELVGHVSRVRLISYFESVLIGKIYTKPLKCWSWLPSYLQDLNIIKPQMLCIKPFARRISLFPFFLPKYRIIVKPNQDNRIEIPHAEPLGKYGDDYEDIESGKCCFEKCQAYRLNRKIVKNAKVVVNKKTYVSEFDEIKNRLSHYETKIVSLENTLKKILLKLE
ncbi:transient receptor potential cation channel protein painless [Nymphalis io]|uniref:transient receptor potential cation channel protein painless n=1 Tax=Inachis io TaxID=171585 RepID=UPI002168FC0D|nr:transient receptor potential cation channel protein painless [Nymphalis io]